MLIGYAFCGSFCTIKESIDIMRGLISAGHSIIPIMSDNVYETDTRFGRAVDIIKEVEQICARMIIHTITEAEALGPRIKLDLLVVCPCTGNTLAKLANGITDTPVTMACKAHRRCERPIVISLASNDAMSANLSNISIMLQKKNVFFVPMKQDDITNKPHSLVADFSLVSESINSAFNSKQLRPLFM